MPMTPRTTHALIAEASDHLAKMQGPAEFWERMNNIKFADDYHRALLAAGVQPGKADEIAAMVRQYISRISDGVETATYLLKELIGEVDSARALAQRDAAAGNGFHV